MIEINEIRIGNLIDYENTTHIVCGIEEPEYIKSWWFKDGKPFIEDSPYDDFAKNYKPIVVTEELLLKFNFELYSTTTNQTMWESVPTIEKTYSYFDEFYITYRNNSFYNSRLQIKSFHELQNIFFIFKKKELINF